MSAQEREAFLAAARIGVVAVARTGRPPLAVPMWYGYEPGGLISFITSRHSREARAIRDAGYAGLCVHADDYPYRYVSVSGPVVQVQETVTEEERRVLARRYLGAVGGDDFVAQRRDATAEMIIIRIRPETWLSQDQSR
jgi:nitroimidazol reductase NimA-like FMN-containing flavoprotein (pyridoxamine 5'-phosphate oxidase superfamily)